MKIRPVRNKFFHAEGRAYMTDFIIAFRNFSKAVKMQFTTNR